MITNQAITTHEDVGHGDLPQIWDAAERLRRMALSEGWRLDKSNDRILENLLTAAASAEQQLAEQQARIRQLESLSVTDELTKVLNRRGFGIELERALARAERRGETGLLLLCDLDHFKAINDTYGHPAGDEVLCELAQLLRSRTRHNDHVARLGGDEFAILITTRRRASPRVWPPSSAAWSIP